MKLDVHKLNRFVFIDAHYPEWDAGENEMFYRWSPSEIVDTAIKAGAQMLSFFAKDHWGNCYYPTDVGHRLSYVKGDFTGDIVAEARRRGLPLLVYYSVLSDDYAARTYPQWQNQNPACLHPPKPYPWLNVGIHQEYLDKMMLPQLREICERYRPDGLFFDTMGVAEPCPCPECKAKFKAYHGCEMDLNALAEDPRPWTMVRTRMLFDFYSQVRDFVKAILPETLLVSGIRSIPWDKDLDKANSKLFDLSLYETSVHWIFKDIGYLGSGIIARHRRTTGVPTLAGQYAFIGCWGELTTKPQAMTHTEALTSLSHGMQMMVGDYLRPWGSLEPETYRRLRTVFKAAEALDPWTIGAKAVTHTAVLADDEPVTKPPVEGIAKALIEAHKQFDILDESGLDLLAEEPAKYKVLLVPSPEKLWKPKRWEKLVEWIRAGGHAIIEGNDLLAGQAGVLCEALGVKDVAPSPYSAFYVALDGKLAIENATQTPLLVHERPVRFTATTGTVLCSLIDPIDEWNLAKGISFRTSVLPPKRSASGPAMTINNFGKGKVILIAGSLGQAYWAHSFPWVRDLLIAALELLSPNPMQVQAPPWVETNLMTVGGNLILHMVQACLNHGAGSEDDFWHGDHYHIIEQTRPLFDIPFAVAAPAKPVSVKLIPDKKPLQFDYADGLVRAVLPRLDIHAAVCLEF